MSYVVRLVNTLRPDISVGTAMWPTPGPASAARQASSMPSGNWSGVMMVRVYSATSEKRRSSAISGWYSVPTKRVAA